MKINKKLNNLWKNLKIMNPFIFVNKNNFNNLRKKVNKNNNKSYYKEDKDTGHQMLINYNNIKLCINKEGNNFNL